MIDRTGRLDLLLLGIVERIASRDPVCMALYQTFEPELRSLLKDLDSPRLRRAVRVLASGEGGQGSGKQAAGPRKKAAASRKRADAFRPRVRIAKPGEEPVEVVEAEWVS